MSDPGLTPAAQEAAEAYARTVVLLGRCAEETHEAAWARLADDAGALAVAADELSAAASALTRDEQATDPTTFHRAAQVAIRRIEPE